MSTDRATKKPTTAWIGIDLASKTFVAALDLPWEPGTPQTSLETMPARQFENSREGVRQCLAWARGQIAAAGLAPQQTALRAVAESTPQTPVFKVAQVYLRGWYGQVDVIRPENPADGPAKSPNVEQVVTAKLRYEPFAGWRVRDLRLWRVPIAEALVLSTRSAEQSISE